MSLSVSKPKKHLLVRLLSDVDLEARKRTRMFGDLGALIEASVMIFDWRAALAAPIKTGRNSGQQVQPPTNVLITQECFHILSMAKTRHSVSINSLVNVALATWLKENPDATLKSWLQQ